MTIALGDKLTEVLVDSGATSSFLSLDYYQWHTRRLEPLTPFIRVVAGTNGNLLSVRGLIFPVRVYWEG